jgi:hypothetical protein
MDKEASNDTPKADVKKRLASLYAYLAKHLNIKTVPKVKFIHSVENESDILGKTGYYDPQSDIIAIYVDGRHPKDILRTFAHECVHKIQHQNNLFNINNEHDTGPGYAQKNTNLRNAEADAYLRGSLLFRDWEDNFKYK